MDDFFVLSKPTVKEVKEILAWAYKNAIRTDVDELNCSVSVRRQKSDKPFSEVMKHVGRKAIGFFRIIYHRNFNPYLIISETSSENVEMVEIFIRSIDVGPVEYFFFIYLEPAKLHYLRKKYELEKL